MAILMGYTSGSTRVMGRSDFSPSSLSFLSVPASMRRGSSYTISMFGVGTNLAAISATFNGAPVTVTSTDGSTVGILIPANFPRKHSNQGYTLTVSVSGVGSVTSTLIPFLPQTGWSFVDLVDPLPRTDPDSITQNMVNESGAPVSAVTGEQIVYQTNSSGSPALPVSVTALGRYGLNAGNQGFSGARSFQAYLIEANGTIGQTATKTITYQDGADTTPDSFIFNAQTGAPLSQWVVSNAITVENVDPGLDIPASITGGEYQVSTDSGGTWGAFTSATTNVQLNYQIRIRLTTSSSYSDARTATFTAGGISADFVVTTAGDPSLAPRVEVDVFQFPANENLQIMVSAFNFSPTQISIYRLDGMTGGSRVLVGTLSNLSASGPYARIESTQFVPNGTQRRYVAVATTSGGQQIESAETPVTITKAPSATLTGPTGVRTGQFNVQVTFDGPMTELSSGDFLFSFPSSSFYEWALSGSEQSYILSVIPPVDFKGPVTITLPAGSGANALGYGTVAPVSVVVQIDTTQVPINPTVVSIGGDNVIAPGETVTIEVQDITLTNIAQVVLAGNDGEYSIPFNGSAQVTIPTFVPTGTYTLKLREFA